MAEPASTAVITLAATAIAVPALTVAGVPLGLRPDLLIAGFSGSIVAIVLLNTVPRTGDTWAELLRTTVRRMFVALSSSLTAGYLAPMALLVANLPDALLLGCTFSVGAGAQQVLIFAIKKFSSDAAPPATGRDTAP